MSENEPVNIGAIDAAEDVQSRASEASASAAVEPLVPSVEIAPVGVRAKTPRRTDPNRWADGTFRPGNDSALVHGGRRRQTPLQAALKDQIRARVLSDLGVEEPELPATILALVDRFAETSLLCDAYFTWLQDQGGPIGTRGRQRAAVAGYLAGLDRQMKLAQLLGLERKRARVPSLREHFAQRDVEKARAARESS